MVIGTGSINTAGKDVDVITDASGTKRLSTDSLTKITSDGDYKAVSISSTATVIYAADADRLAILIQSLASKKVYIGFDASVTTSNGIELSKAVPLSIDGYTGDLYGIVASGTADVRAMELRST